jgi:hypothetical protein
MVVACVALVVASGGTSYAALTITGRNVKNSSLTGKDIKNSSLTTSDVKNRSLLSADFKAGQLPAGPQGPQGTKGDTGPRGPSDAYHAEDDAYGAGNTTVTKAVPAGKYAVNGKAVFYDFNSNGTSTGIGQHCNLTATGSTRSDIGYASYGSGGINTAAVQQVFDLPSGGTISFACTVTDTAGDSIGDQKLNAIRVETLN